MVSDEKQKLVQVVSQQIRDSPVVGIVNVHNLPAQQLQTMKALLRKRGVAIRMLRKRLMVRALHDSGKQNIDDLATKMGGLPALILSTENPFSLYATLQKNKSEAPARAGQILPKDVHVKAGPTGFAPGPIISELASFGIKTKVENGKLSIIADTIVGKEGSVVTTKLAETLKRLDIKSIEIGLDLVAVWESGTIYNGRDLHIDEAEYFAKFTQAAQWAFNLAVEGGIFTPETTERLLQKAFCEAKAVSVEAFFITEETREELLAKSEQEALSVKTTAGL